MFEDFPNLGKGTNILVQEAQKVPKKMNPKRPTRRHIVIKMANVKDKETILKAARMKHQVTYKGNPLRLSADLSEVTLQAKREWWLIVLKERNL